MRPANAIVLKACSAEGPTSSCQRSAAHAGAGARELLQGKGEGRMGKDKGGNIIPETEPDGSSETDVVTASCTACSGSCESCASLDIEAGVTIDNCGKNAAGVYTCDVSLSSALMPWKAGSGISWGRISGGKCGAALPLLHCPACCAPRSAPQLHAMIACRAVLLCWCGTGNDQVLDESSAATHLHTHRLEHTLPGAHAAGARDACLARLFRRKHSHC